MLEVSESAPPSAGSSAPSSGQIESCNAPITIVKLDGTIFLP